MNGPLCHSSCERVGGNASGRSVPLRELEQRSACAQDSGCGYSGYSGYRTVAAARHRLDSGRNSAGEGEEWATRRTRVTCHVVQLNAVFHSAARA